MKKITNEQPLQTVTANSYGSTSYNRENKEVEYFNDWQNFLELNSWYNNNTGYYVTFWELDSGNNITITKSNTLVTWTNLTYNHFVIWKIDYVNKLAYIVWTYYSSGLQAKIIKIDFSDIANLIFTASTSVLLDSNGKSYFQVNTKRKGLIDEKFVVAYKSADAGVEKFFIRHYEADYTNLAITSHPGSIVWNEKVTVSGVVIKYKYNEVYAVYTSAIWTSIIWGYIDSNDSTIEKRNETLLQDSNLSSISTIQNKADFTFIDEDSPTNDKIILSLGNYLTIINPLYTDYQEGTPLLHKSISYWGKNINMFNSSNGILFYNDSSSWGKRFCFFEVSNYTIVTGTEIDETTLTYYYYNRGSFSKIKDNKYLFTSRYTSYSKHYIFEVSEWVYPTVEQIDTSDILELAVDATQLLVNTTYTAPWLSSVVTEYQLNENGTWIEVPVNNSYFIVDSFNKVRFRFRKIATATDAPIITNFKAYWKE